MVDVKYRLVTDPSEGPKLFQIDTRVTSRGETAVLLTGIDCAERVVCHEAVSFDLAEGEFVFKLGAGNAQMRTQAVAGAIASGTVSSISRHSGLRTQ